MSIFFLMFIFERERARAGEGQRERECLFSVSIFFNLGIIFKLKLFSVHNGSVGNYLLMFSVLTKEFQIILFGGFCNSQNFLSCTSLPFKISCATSFCTNFIIFCEEKLQTSVYHLESTKMCIDRVNNVPSTICHLSNSVLLH